LRLPTDIPDCVLRSWHDTDKDALILHCNNRQIWRNLTGIFPHPYTEDDALKWIEIANRSGRDVNLAVEFSGKAIGGIGIRAGNDVNVYTATLGYWIGEAYWGNGIATAAVKAMIAYVLFGNEFARLEARVFAWNPASMRVLEKVGFVREGVLKYSIFKDGQIVDSVLYALVRDTKGLTLAEDNSPF
jgi:RimJ/RimL family protein N-acetyltransferase